MNHRPPDESPEGGDEDNFICDVSDWYVNSGVSYPLLSDNICTVYEHRPSACRDHYVHDNSEVCMNLGTSAQPVKMPVNMVEVLGEFASELEGTSVEAVMMPLILAWYEGNSSRAKRMWPSKMMVERFVNIVKAKAEENSMLSAIPIKSR